MNYITTHQKPPLSFPSVSGSIVTFNSQYAGLPLKSHKIALTATQSGSGTPSPDNVRTINGWDAIHIGNISDNTNISYFQGLLNGTYGFVDLGSLSWIYDSAYNRFNTNVASIKPMPKARIGNVLCPRYNTINDGRPVGNVPNLSIYQGTNTDLSVVDHSYTDATVFRTSLNGVYLIYELKTPTTPSITNAQFEALCEAFGMNGQSFTIQIGSTVYGGEYDARTGLFTATYKYFSYDYTTPWAHEISADGYNNFYFICPSDIKAGQNAENSSMMCSASPISAYSGAQIDHCFISNSRNFNFTWGDTLGITTAQGFKDYLQANNLIIEVLAELAVPTTIQLPPCPIDTLLGENNIWADTGDTTLQYPKFG